MNEMLIITSAAFYTLIGSIVFLLWAIGLTDDKSENPTILQTLFMMIICGPVVFASVIFLIIFVYGFIIPAKWIYEKLGNKKNEYLI
jgi:hypothetical protein